LRPDFKRDVRKGIPLFYFSFLASNSISYRILVQRKDNSFRRQIKSAIITSEKDTAFTQDKKEILRSLLSRVIQDKLNYHFEKAPVAQWTEHQPSKLLVVGSTPTGGA
jgi:hypothetical protein